MKQEDHLSPQVIKAKFKANIVRSHFRNSNPPSKKRPHILSFYLYEMPRIGLPIVDI
jgi:hypothetical protein